MERDGPFSGRLDSPLTARGVAQARAYGGRLAALPGKIDAMIASPLGRVRETTAIIRTCGDFPPMQWDDRLAEVSLGQWDGLTSADVDAQWPGALAGSSPFDWFFRSSDGESYDAAMRRARRWLDGAQGRVVAVSHGLLTRFIRGAYLELEKDQVLALPVSQDVIWQLSGGRIAAIPVA